MGEVRALARLAPVDPAAMQQLLSIDNVDGRHVDIRGALAGASPDQLETRLKTLAHDVTPSAATSPARRTAQQILRGKQFRRSSLPRPFRGVLDRIDRFLRKVFGPITRHLPRAGSKWWIVIGAIVVALAAFVAFRLARRRRSVEAEYATLIRTKALRPEELERTASEAEAAGRTTEAIRLRFAAGLIRLDRAGAIEWHPSITSGNVRRKLRSKQFDSVAASFERVTYGNREATPDDLELSRQGWDKVLEDAKR